MTEIDPDSGAALRLVMATRRGDHEYVADVLAPLAAGPPSHAAAVIRDLIDFCAQAAVTRAGETGAVYTFDVTTDQDEPIEVDTLPPGPRATLRALVSTLNGDGHDRDFHADIAARGTPTEVATVLTQCLLWTLELTDAAPSNRLRLSCFTT